MDEGIQYVYIVAEWITQAECAAYDYCVNTLQELLPQADVERMFKGVGLIIGGAFKETGGIMLAAASATVSWTGLGFFGMGAGIITASAGASDIQQGIEEFSLGWSGDNTTRTTNGLCDMLYSRNENIYHVSTGTSAMAGNLLTSYVNAAYSENIIRVGTTEKGIAEKAAWQANDAYQEAVTLKHQATSGVQLTSTPGKTTTILGRYGSDTGAIIEELGIPHNTNPSGNPGEFNLLNTPDNLFTELGADGFGNKYNKPFLDAAVNCGDEILMATPIIDENLYLSGSMELTGYGRDISIYWKMDMNM